MNVANFAHQSERTQLPPRPGQQTVPVGPAAGERTTHSDRRRALLLEAAGRVFVHAPSGGLTLAAVAKEAGVSKRLMYHYFADVQSLYNELFRGRLADHVGNVDAHLSAAPPETPRDRIATAVRVFLMLPATYRRWALMAVVDSLPPELQRQSGPVLDLLIARWSEIPPFSSLDVVALRTVMSMVLTNVCMLGTAMDEGTLTLDQATNIGVATIMTIVHAAHDETAPPVDPH